LNQENLLNEAVIEAIEDIGMLNAIRESSDEYVDEAKVMNCIDKHIQKTLLTREKNIKHSRRNNQANG